MILQEQIKDFDGRVLGFIDEDTETGDRTAKDRYQKVLGFYVKNQDMTQDFYRGFLARGDILVSLVYNADHNRNL